MSIDTIIKVRKSPFWLWTKGKLPCGIDITDRTKASFGTFPFVPKSINQKNQKKKKNKVPKQGIFKGFRRF